MRARSISVAGLVIVASAGATTLQQLSLDDMIRQSTGIVRAKVTGSHSALRGQNIYTYYRLAVLEEPKRVLEEPKRVLEGAQAGPAGQDIEVAVPGGTVNGIRQVAIGSPELATGSEYVVFLWTGKSGLTQIIGLSQGLFLAVKDASGNIRLSRPAAEEPMLDKSGRPVAASSTGLNWSDVRARIVSNLGGSNLGGRDQARESGK